MTIKLKGILDIHGEQGVGKTLMALGVASPELVAYLYDDVKELQMEDEEIQKIGYVVDLVQLWKGKKFLEIRDMFFKEIDKIPQSCEVLVVDTWGKRIGPSLQYWGKINYKQFREANTFSVGDYLYGQMWGEAYLYEASVISDLKARFKTVVLVSHLKDNYEAGAKTGKMEPMVGREIPRICTFRVWLKRNPNSSVPIGLVHKPISANRYIEGELETINLLPRRLCAKEGEKSVWHIIERYKKEPFGNRKPLPEEEPTEFEASILDGILTTEQKEIWRANLLEKQRKAEAEAELFNTEWQDAQTRVLELARDLEGPPPIKAAKILEQLGGEWTHKDIVEMLAL